jgi:hypothetical protein
VKTNSFAVGHGVCTPNRLKATAAHFAELKGPAALENFLHCVAGVSDVSDVPADDRFRVNAAFREAINDAEKTMPPLHKALGRIRSKTFARRKRP